MIGKDFKSIFELLEMFPDEQSCIDYLEEKRWGGDVVSPFDDSSRVYKCKNNRYRCKNTGKYFNVRTNTLFDNTKVGLRKWFLAIYLVTSHKKGISSCQLAKDLRVTQKTAWFILQRIRTCFEIEEDIELDGVVEIDETFVGGKNKNRHWNKKVPKSQGRSFKDKTPVFGMLQRNGIVIARVVPDTSVKSLLPHILKHIRKGSTIYTDEWNYGNLSEKYNHDYIHHGARIYAQGEVYTNTLEGFWSIFKRGIMGIYHITSRKHLQKYVNEFVFRYNTRKISEKGRFDLLLQNTERRLKYKDLTTN
ncbi:IS1595 family transposase [Dysgonomonas sp. ZJ279]|uniref:IS1595 family transposase n=1 Tax=Dysgonomonas sp. ZJ279 TaxID=2709796 RepID=UPI0013EA017C|nr:IS1595 family transposase [Dysgonomonas sp. ZJ279]